MTISYTLSEKEFVSACYRTRRESRGHLVFSIVLLVLIAGVGAFFITTGDAWSGISFLFFACLLAIWRFAVGPRRMAALTYRSSKFMYDSITAEISEEGTRMTYPSGNSFTHWNGYVRWRQTDKMFVLFLSNRLLRMFPKRAFAAGDLEAMQELLQKKLPKNR